MNLTREFQESGRSFDNSRPLEGTPPCSEELLYLPNNAGCWFYKTPFPTAEMSAHTVEKTSLRKDHCPSLPQNVVIKIEPQMSADQQCDKMVIPNVFVASEVGQNTLQNNLGYQCFGHNMITKIGPKTHAEERPYQHNNVYPQNIFTNSDMVAHTTGCPSRQNAGSQSSLQKVVTSVSMETHTTQHEDMVKNNTASDVRFVDVGIQTEDDIRCCNNSFQGFQKQDRILQSKDKANTSASAESIATENVGQHSDNVLCYKDKDDQSSDSNEKANTCVSIGSTDTEKLSQCQEGFRDFEVKQESNTCPEEKTIEIVTAESVEANKLGQHKDAFVGFKDKQDLIPYCIQQSSMSFPVSSMDQRQGDGQSFAENHTATWTRRKTHQPQKYDTGIWKNNMNNFVCMDDQPRYLENNTLDVPPRQYECPDCGKVVSNKGSLVAHRRTHVNDKPFVCTECDRRFVHNCYLIAHVRSHACEKQHVCTECGKAFLTPKLLNEHKVIHTGEKPMQCKECGYVCAMKKRLYQHMQIHRTDRNFQCEQCHKKFTLKSSLKKHMRVHTGEKPFRCTDCDRTFTWTDNLVKHRRIHTGEKPYQCDRCGNRYSQKTGLDSHMKTHEKEDRAQTQ